MNSDNIYVQILFAIIAFAVCVYFLGTVIAPQSKETYDRIYNETASVIGEENISKVYIEDGCIFIYDNNDVLVSAGGVFDKNGVKLKTKFSILPPFIRTTVVSLNENNNT